MNTEQLITVDDFCAIHDIEVSFIFSLQQSGLLEMSAAGETSFIDASQLRQLEKIIRFYYELDINLEGIETITHLLQRITSLQDEVLRLNNRLRLYEGSE